jgi:hypothetical protein
MTDKAISLLVHGPTKVGKSSLSITAPYPRLYLDVEAASRFLPINKKVWDPYTEEIPQPDGTWDTAVVYCRDYDTMRKVYTRINQEPHQFKSLIIDSISELQIRLRESIAGRGPMQMQQWGELLTEFAGLLRDLRDLTMHPTCPIEALVMTAMTEDKDGFFQPYLQGSVRTQAPYLFDVVGYLFVDREFVEGQESPQEVRKLLTRKHQQFEAGERVQGKLDEFVRAPNIEQMLNAIFPEVINNQESNDTHG